MAGPFALDGYDVLAPLGPSARSWRARCLADGRPVVLRRCVGAGARVAEVRRCAALWGSAVGAGAVAVRDVVRAGDDLVVVSELAAGGGVQALLARHGSLSAGQIVTLVVGVAEALAAAHDHGLAHGRIRAGNVVLDADARPLLTDYVWGQCGEAASDVTSLSTLAMEMLGDDPPAELSAALRSTTDARLLADAVRATLPAEPLTSAAVVTADTRHVDAAEGPRSRGVVAAAVAAVVLVAVLAGVSWGRHDNAAGSELPQRATPMTSAAASWLAVVRDLETRRAVALDAGSMAQLSDVETPGTALWRHDRSMLLRLKASHERMHGMHAHVGSVRLLSMAGSRARVQVNDAWSPRAVVLVLQRGQHGWLIRRVISPRSH